MAEAIAKAGAEGAMEEYKEVRNVMTSEAATEAGNYVSLQGGLQKGITGKPRSVDPNYREARRAEILRGKQPVALSQQGVGRSVSTRTEQGHSDNRHQRR